MTETRTGRPPIEKTIGEPAETLNIYLGAPMLRKLQQRAHDQQRSVASLVREALMYEYGRDS